MITFHLWVSFELFLGVRGWFPSVFQRKLCMKCQHNYTALCFGLKGLIETWHCSAGALTSVQMVALCNFFVGCVVWSFFFLPYRGIWCFLKKISLGNLHWGRQLCVWWWDRERPCGCSKAKLIIPELLRWASVQSVACNYHSSIFLGSLSYCLLMVMRVSWNLK